MLTLILTISIICMPIWALFTQYYVPKPSPIILYREINPFYYLGLACSLLALILPLFGKQDKQGHRVKPTPYLLSALLTAMYVTTPPLALFQYPFSDHSNHVTPIYWILRNYNINWPKHLGHPETVSPQLTMAILIMFTGNSSVFDLHRLCVILLPSLVVLFIYLLSQELGFQRKYAALVALLALTLSCQSYYFLRQTFTMPIYILIAYLIAKSLTDRRCLIPLIIMILAFISMDPAFILLTIVPLAMYPLLQLIQALRAGTKKANIRRYIRLIVTICVVLFGLYFLWISVRYPEQLRDLYSIANKMIETFFKALHEPSILTPREQYYWGRPTALAYNEYYNTLYNFKVFVRATSIILASITSLLLIVKSGVNNRSFEIAKHMLITSYLIITTITIITKGYGATFAPWTAVVSTSLIQLTPQVLSRRVNILAIVTCYTLVLVLSSIIVPHMLVIGRVKLYKRDLHFISWLSSYVAPQHSGTSIQVLGFGRWLSEYAYIRYAIYIVFKDYLFYEGLSYTSIFNIAREPKIALTTSALMHFENTVAVYDLATFLYRLLFRLYNTHDLVYSSGVPYVMLWYR